MVTGGGSGIGFSVAKELAAKGAEVCVVGRRPGALDEAVAQLGDGCWAAVCDLARESEVSELSERLRSRWRHLDGLVNNAGIAPMASLRDTQTDVWDHTFAVNVRGPYLLIREALPLLEAASSPAIVNVSSTLAEKAIPGMAAYNASKAALNQLTRSLSLELAPKIRVNAVMPAVVDTPIHAARGMSAEQVHSMAGLHPIGRVGQPEDVAALICFLLSESSSWMTGTVIPVDGGMMAT